MRKYISVQSYVSPPGEPGSGDCIVDPTGYIPHGTLIARMLYDGVVPDMDEARTYYEHTGPVREQDIDSLPYNPTTSYSWDIIDAQRATEEMEARIAASKAAAAAKQAAPHDPPLDKVMAVDTDKVETPQGNA